MAGTVTAESDGVARVTGSVYERIGKSKVATGWFDLDVPVVAGQPATWSAEVAPATTIAFGAGNAEVRAHATVERWYDTSDADAIKTVKLATASTTKPPKPPKP